MGFVDIISLIIFFTSMFTFLIYVNQSRFFSIHHLVIFEILMVIPIN